jgi:hypothetical protein
MYSKTNFKIMFLGTVQKFYKMTNINIIKKTVKLFS